MLRHRRYFQRYYLNVPISYYIPTQENKCLRALSKVNACENTVANTAFTFAKHFRHRQGTSA